MLFEAILQMDLTDPYGHLGNTGQPFTPSGFVDIIFNIND